MTSVYPRPVYIYALRDPNSRLIRYVGAAIDPLARYQRHLSPSQLRASTYKIRWIKMLLAHGQCPDLLILDETDEQHWQSAERSFITIYRSCGYPLTNGTGGGAGRIGARASNVPVARHTPLTDEHRSAIAKARKGQRMSDEQRARLSSMKLGQPISHWVNRSFTAEHRAHLSEAHRGRKHSPETRAKIAAARRKRE